ncbi:hypothetical protein BDV29DRAFT_187562 [Aspergillus leporis]|uniref:Xylanolytic transcriptional activator regulatory domain-containing protein n=1 Tax=Aspergillus leporis TaxID=41062 RepID=A0A5N5XDW1_9EURO|nr:hypothetical protein BDV29DRAFT_187562 [Aspergillus leporis]
MCQAHGTNCIYPQPDDSFQRRSIASPRKLAAKSRQAPRSAAPHPQTIPPLANPDSTPRDIDQRLARRLPASLEASSYPPNNEDYNREETLPNLVGLVAEVGDNSSHIVSPAVAEDNEILETYLSTIPDARRRYIVRTNPNSSRPVRPVLFNTVPRRPLGVSANQSLQAMALPIAECHIVSFRNAYVTHKKNISPALLCNLYANSLVYWGNSPRLRSGRCPDIRFIWNLANEALYSELFLSPGISTVMAIILNVCGRPSISIFGNGECWNIRPMEKRFRVRIWWRVVVHDSWCSLAYGTPLQIHRAQYHVPFPTLDDLCSPGASNLQIAASSVLIALTTLTEVLGRYLEHVYEVSRCTAYPPETSAVDLERLLTEWEQSLSDDIRRVVLRGTHLSAPGAANFRLAYLAVKLLLRRIQLDLDTASMQLNGDIVSPFYTQAQRAAEEIVHLVEELDESYFCGFWIPVHAFSLTSATTFLLRSGLLRRNLNGNAPLKLAKDMISTLRSHRDNFNWDLADNCLANCSDLVEKIDSAETEGDSLMSAVPDFQEHLDTMNPSILDELLIGFPALADMIEI